jgi:hypothetical protein
MGRLTFGYGIAQMLAPMIVGYLAQSEGSYQSGLLITLAVIIVGAVLLAGAWYVQQQSMEPDDTAQSFVDVLGDEGRCGHPVATRRDSASGTEFS